MPRRDQAQALLTAGRLDVGGYRIEGEAELPLWEFPTAEVLSHYRGTYRSRTVDRYRADGPVVWAEIGAWPWALTPEGRLPRSWWRRPEYADALRDWAEGRLP